MLVLFKGDKEWDICYKLIYVSICLDGVKDLLIKCDLDMVKIRFVNVYIVIFF